MPKERKLARIAERTIEKTDLTEQGQTESEKKQEEVVEGSPACSKPSSQHTPHSSPPLSDEGDDLSVFQSSSEDSVLSQSNELNSSQPLFTAKRKRGDVDEEYTQELDKLATAEVESGAGSPSIQNLHNQESTQAIDELEKVVDESCAGSVPAASTLSTPVSSSDYVRVSQRLRGVSISPEEFARITSIQLFDDRQQERVNAGNAWGRFESAKQRKHCVVGLDQLSPSSQERIRKDLEQRPNVVKTFLPGTPSPTKSTAARHIWTPSHTTKLEESSTFTVGGIRLGVFVDKTNMKRPIGFVVRKNLNNEFEKLVGNKDPDLLMTSPAIAENQENQENHDDKESNDGNIVLNEGSATFSSVKYIKSYKYSLEKQHRSQVSIKKETAGAFFEGKGYEPIIGTDGKQEVEWLDGLSRDLLRRAATSIIVNTIPCKLVPKNLNLVALSDGKSVCTNLILFAGTRGCNTHMMVAEGVVRLLLRKGIDVQVRYKYINDREMDYFIDTKVTGTIHFTFDTKKYDSPTSLEPKLVSTVISEIVESAKQKQSSPSVPPAAAQSSTPSPTPFAIKV
jgi:hypothetical protein